VLSGMSSMQQVEENVAHANEGNPDSLSQEELKLFKEAENEYNKRIAVPCTGCRYCMPCPSNVGIPECFEMYNQGCMFNDPDVAGTNCSIILGGMFMGSPGFASLCQECGECEDKCPQGIPIQEHLKKVSAYFGR
jgi:uncharacterized protein